MKEARLLPLVPSDDPVFDAFWLAYPRHDHKFEAKQAWAKLKLGPKAVEQVMTALAANLQRRDWAQNIRDGKLEFIPLASTWLNKRRFENEVLKPVPPEVRWYNECAQLHQNACENRTHHELRKIRDGLSEGA